MAESGRRRDRSPKLIVEIKVPDTAVTPEQVTTEVTDNIQNAIKSVTGLEMRVSVVEPEEGGSLWDNGVYI